MKTLDVTRLKLDKKNPLHVLLATFCAPKVTPHGDLRYPFFCDGFVWATDGTAMARIPDAGYESFADKISVPDVVGTWTDCWKLATAGRKPKWKSRPAESLVSGVGPCPECWGEHKKCPWCNGRGCEECFDDGVIGRPSCETCHGHLFGHDYQCVQEVGNRRIGLIYWRKIQAIPNARYCASGSSTDVLAISGDGIDAVVMPLGGE